MSGQPHHVPQSSQPCPTSLCPSAKWAARCGLHSLCRQASGTIYRKLLAQGLLAGFASADFRGDSRKSRPEQKHRRRFGDGRLRHIP